MKLPLFTRPTPKRLGSQSGQSLILAVIVMFLLVFLGIMFIVIVSRNLTRTARSTDVTEATQLAEAGIRYADRMLTQGEDGADWRPVPDNLGWDMTYDAPTRTWSKAPAGNIAQVMKDHPDWEWLRPYAPAEAADHSEGPTGGFTSYKTGGGRYLIRVTYNPDSKDPMSKYIRIESIGRVGVVDDKDPTTWGPASKIKLRRELTAYKPIGVTDYARFITNKEKKNDFFALGCPERDNNGAVTDYHLQFGRPGATDSDPYEGAPIRVNGNLTWYGNQVDIYLNGKSYDDNGTPQYIPIDSVEVAGEIRHDVTKGTNGSDSWINVLAHEYDVANNTKADFTLVPSRDNSGQVDPAFETARGFYRDGRPETGSGGAARGIKRIEPPLLDEEDPATKLTRYRLLTLHSGTWRTVNNRRFNTGRYGWGEGIYVDNRRDLQPESEVLFGGYSLRSDWLKPGNDMAAYWKGSYYVPPGVIIVLNPEDTDGDGQADMTVTRTDTDQKNNRKAVWRDYDGVRRPDWGQTITMPYPTPDRKIKDPTSNNMIDLPGNGVLFAEGNVRIRGMLPPNVQLTVVSNGTIYIEGNVLKNRAKGTAVADQTSAIALLAKDYICVNTTQFVSLLTSLGPLSLGSDSMNGDPPYHLIVTPEPQTNFTSIFTNGPPDGWNGTSMYPSIFVRHAGEHGPAYINMRLNPHMNPTTPWPGDMYTWPLGGNWVKFFGVGDSAFGGINAGQTTLYRTDVWPLNSTGGSGAPPLPAINWNIGYPNYLDIGVDQAPFDGLGLPVIPEVRNYFLSAFALQPMDVRIEAVMYAQERSFFVIPGYWFNPNPNDTGGNRPAGTDPRFPLFGQPLDVKITIDGAVTENVPAPLGDVSEWMIKWGKIPATYGSSAEPTAHPGQGLTFLYDRMVGWPVYKNANNTEFVRRDAYGRPLPITPRLPVCQSLIYFGDAP